MRFMFAMRSRGDSKSKNVFEEDGVVLYSSDSSSRSGRMLMGRRTEGRRVERLEL